MVRVGCDVPGCWRKHYTRGLCQMHHQRVKRWGHTGSHYPQCAYVGPKIGRCRRYVHVAGASVCYKHRQLLETTGVYAGGGGPRGEHDIMST